MCHYIKFVTLFYRTPDDEDSDVTKKRQKSVANKSSSTKLLVYFILCETIYFICRIL